MRLITRGYGEEHLIVTRGLVGLYDSVLVTMERPNIRRMTMKENVRGDEVFVPFVPSRLKTHLKITWDTYRLFIKEL